MLTPLIEKVARNEDLTAEEAAAVMREVLAGRAAPAALAGLLVALVMKGERPAEVVGFARTMREHAVKLSAPAGDVFDTCGTGGDRSGSFNISSATALVVAACGVKVAKHGNRAASSQCGSADVFERLGVNLAAPPAVVERSLHDANIAFFFAQTFHPSMKHAAPIRRELGVRTAFNLLGPLTNPAGASRQIVGVPRPDFTELVARALALLGSTRAWVVHGAAGIEPLAMTGRLAIARKDTKRVAMQVNRMVPSGVIHQAEHIASATAHDEERIECGRSVATADGHTVHGPRHSTGHGTHVAHHPAREDDLVSLGSPEGRLGKRVCG